MIRRNYLCIWCCVLSLAAAGCFKTNKATDPGNPEDRDPGTRDDQPVPVAGRDGSKPREPDTGKPVNPEAPPTPPLPAARCVQGGFCREIELDAPQIADLLFVVDNSGSMSQEQRSLRQQFPKLIQTLTTGLSSSGRRFPPLRDLHLGVVSTDMGLAGIANNFPGCNTQRHINGGDDGVLLHPGVTAPGCAAMYPPFLAYSQGLDDPDKVAKDFGCITALGTSGCGFEQQLEAGLKALWPKNYVDADGNVYPPEKNPILFLATTNEGRFGHGDVPITQGGNAGFARPGSLLAIVVVTDEEDCSSRNTSHFVSTNDPMNPLSKQGINLRCFYNKQNLFEIDRYVKGFQGLRPGRERDVLFAAIVGVPVELVSAEARSQVDFADEASRDAYYEGILNDTRMIERPMNENVPAIANVAPSCTRTDQNGERADAYPPRRIVEVARGMGQNATVQSICQDDFGPAMDGIIELTQARTTLACLPVELRRASNGKVECEVIWELPKGDGDCAVQPFLHNVGSPRPKLNERGGRTCKVTQLPVTTHGEIPSGEGFYYDDFSAARYTECRAGSPGRISFSEGAKPPSGVRAFLDCSADAIE
jgi:hypothetical protein